MTVTPPLHRVLLVALLMACDAPPIGTSRPVPTCAPSGPEVGLDGVDNDCDGRVDCDDPDLTEPFSGVVTEAYLDVVCADACPREVLHGIELVHTDIEDLSALSCVTATPTLGLYGNERLRTLEGMPLLQELDAAVLSGNPALTSLHGWTDLGRIGDLSVTYGDRIETIELRGQVQGLRLLDLPALTEVRLPNSVHLDRLVLQHAPALHTVSAPALVSAGEVLVEGLTSLVELGDLASLREVDALSLYGNPSLVGLTDLPKLTTIGSLAIGPQEIDLGWSMSEYLDPSSFRTLEGLSAVQTVGSASIHGTALETLEGFAPSELGDLDVSGIPDLSALNGTAITGEVGVAGADVLGLQSTERLQRLTLWAVADLESLQGLRAVTGELSLSFVGEGVADLGALAGLQEVGELVAQHSEGLETIEIPGLRSGSLRLDDLPALERVGGFTGLHATDLTFHELPDDVAIDLSGVTRLDGALFVRASPVPVALGFTEVGGQVTLWNTPATHLDTLALRGIGGSLAIDDNADLVDVTGLHGLTSVAGDVFVVDNEALPQAAVRGLVEAIDTIGGTVTRRNNGP